MKKDKTLKRKNPSVEEAKEAIKTLHHYYSQPAITLDESMLKLLNQPFIDVVLEGTILE